MSLFFLLAAMAPGVTVTLSGETVAGADVGDPTTVGLRFTSGGIVEKSTDGSLAVYTQVDADTDWILPNSVASGDYSIRLTVDSGSTPTTGTVGSWEALNTTRTWTLTRAGSSGTNTGTYTVEISDDGGTTTIATNTYVLSATII